MEHTSPFSLGTEGGDLQQVIETEPIYRTRRMLAYSFVFQLSKNIVFLLYTTPEIAAIKVVSPKKPARADVQADVSDI